MSDTAYCPVCCASVEVRGGCCAYCGWDFLDVSQQYEPPDGVV